MKKLKIAIVGLGMIGKMQLDAIVRVPEAEVIALVNPTIQKAKDLAKKYEIPYVFSNIDEMLKTVHPDVVHNCSPDNFHNEINLKCIAAGIHVLSEKPLARSSKEAMEVLNAKNEHPGLVMGINHVYRMYPMVQELHERLEIGEIGKVLTVHGRYLQDSQMFDDAVAWRFNPEMIDLPRAIADIGVHWIDLYEFLLQDRITSVCADMHTVYPIRKRPLPKAEGEEQKYEEFEVHTDDICNVLFETEKGIHGLFYVSKVAGGHGNDLEIEINGSKASYFWKQETPNEFVIGTRMCGNTTIARNPVTLSERAKAYTRIARAHNEGVPDALLNMMNVFYDYILNNRTDEPVFTTIEQGVHYQEIIEALVKSSKEKRWVFVGE